MAGLSYLEQNMIHGINSTHDLNEAEIVDMDHPDCHSSPLKLLPPVKMRDKRRNQNGGLLNRPNGLPMHVENTNNARLDNPVFNIRNIITTPLDDSNRNSYLDDLAQVPFRRIRHGSCIKCREICSRLSEPFLTEHNPLTPESTKWQKLKYALLCPPHGHLAHWITLALTGLCTWTTVWSFMGEEALPGGPLFWLLILVASGYLFGQFIAIFGLPPTYGMFVVGCISRTIPGDHFGESIDQHLSFYIRSFGLVLYLLQSGLELNLSSVRQLSSEVVRLALLPAFAEAVSIAVTSRLLLEIPWHWAALLGCIMCPVSSATIIPRMLSLRERGFGILLSIPTTILTAAGIDHILPLLGFTIFISTIFTKEAVPFSILYGLLHIGCGMLGGFLIGGVLSFIPHQNHRHLSRIRVGLLLAVGTASVMGTNRLMYPGSGMIACFMLAFIAGLGWRRHKWETENTSYKDTLEILMSVVEPFLFVLCGAQTDFSHINTHALGAYIGIILVGTVLRGILSFLSMCGTQLAFKHRIFVLLAWMPKITFQVVVGSLIVDCTMLSGYIHDIDIAKKVAAVSTLASLAFVPLGTGTSSLCGPCLLTQTIKHCDDQSDDDEDDPSCLERQEELTWDDHLDFDTELTKMKVDLSKPFEITTEMETVT